MTEAILICDPPAGDRWLVTVDRPMSIEEMDRLRDRFSPFVKQRENSVLILERGADVKLIHDRAWPDAEFCAA